MSRARPFLVFWSRLVVGDEWRLTAPPLLALALTIVLNHDGLATWWLLPITVALALTGSLRRAARRRPTSPARSSETQQLRPPGSSRPTVGATRRP